MSSVIPIIWQYCRNGLDITTNFYAEQDADEVRAWDDDFCVLEVRRDGQDPTRWRITGSDGRRPDQADDQLFDDPSDALGYLAVHHGATYPVATDRP
jgi:hypothetical protein